MKQKIGKIVADPDKITFDEDDIKLLSDFFELPVIQKAVENREFNELLNEDSSIYETEEVKKLVDEDGDFITWHLPRMLIKAGIDFIPDEIDFNFEIYYLDEINEISIKVVGNGHCCLNHCDNLEKVTAEIEDTKNDAFFVGSCNNIHTLEFIGTKNISSYSARIDNLWEVILPSTLESIERRCFFGARDLGKIIYKGTAEQFKKIKITDDADEGTMDSVWAEFFYGSGDPTHHILVKCSDCDLEIGNGGLRHK